MKTTKYNPSPLEVEFSQALKELKDQIQEYLSENKVLEVNDQKQNNNDNPGLIFKLKDKDGDPHEVVVKIIQRSDDVL